MRLPTHRDQRHDLRRLAARYIRRAEISVVRQQCFDAAKLIGQNLELLDHRCKLLLVVRRLHHVCGHHQEAVRSHRRLRVIALLEPTARHRHDA